MCSMRKVGQKTCLTRPLSSEDLRSVTEVLGLRPIAALQRAAEHIGRGQVKPAVLAENPKSVRVGHTSKGTKCAGTNSSPECLSDGYPALVSLLLSY